jgi:large subunit ribosomal protein L6
MHSGINQTIITRKINIPENVNINFLNDYYIFNGPKGYVKHYKNENLLIEIENQIITIKTNLSRPNKKINNLALINTTIAIFKNNINGVINLFEKNISIKGIGYKAEYKNFILKLFIGYSHPITLNIPQNIILELPTQTNICIKGTSKHQVGQIAHEIKMKKPADIYKNNGIKYRDENIKLKSPKKTR